MNEPHMTPDQRVALFRALRNCHGEDEGQPRFDAVLLGTDPGVIAWRNLGKRKARP